MLDKAPFVKLLEAMVDDLKAADWEDMTGAVVNPRHYRQRRSNQEERPSLAVMMLSDGPFEEDVQQISHHEKLMVLEVVLIAENDIPPEDPDEGSPVDLTGVEGLARILDGAMLVLRDPNSVIYGLVHDIADGLKELDEASQADIGRLTRAVSVLYRVRSDDENVLLAQGD